MQRQLQEAKTNLVRLEATRQAAEREMQELLGELQTLGIDTEGDIDTQIEMYTSSVRADVEDLLRLIEEGKR